ncbi:MAG TPA: cysteine desulfurase [Pirellulales bacterium]|jgi:cysteine desulfurase/selenocysteine lyase|nr:cysteine desulfurase [Pirellulales bacterium]
MMDKALKITPEATTGKKIPGLDPLGLRADFPILSTLVHEKWPLVYLDNAATTQRPRQVIDSMVDVYETKNANVHRGIHWLSEQSTNLYEEARNKVSKFINAADSREIIFTRGTTEGINLVARSWGDANIRAGDEILLTEMEHHANIVPWQQLAERTGAIIRWLPITDEGHLALDNLESYLGPRTRLLAVTEISNVLGTINPVAELIERAHAQGILVLLDAAQSVAHRGVDVRQLGADFVVFGGHKMLGPTGIGVLYGRSKLLKAMPPFIGGGGMIRRVRKDGFEPADLPLKFEAGTPPIVEAIGLGVAIDYLDRVGLPAIHQYEQMLTTRAHEVLQAVGDVRIIGPSPRDKIGIVSFVMRGIHAHDIAQILDRYGIAVRAGHHCTMPLHKRLGLTATTRASFYFYNTLDEIDKLGTALEETKKIFRRR